MKKFIYTLIFITSSLFSKECKHELAICTIFKDDTKYLPEWVEFHLNQGVQHIFLYENNSPDDYENILKNYIESGVVEIISWRREPVHGYPWNSIQCDAYLDCIKKNKKNCTWIAFIDTDEFLFSPSHMDLKRLLKDYKQYAGVSVNWVMYGNSGIDKLEANEKMTDKLVYRGYMNIQEHKTVKTIVQPKYVVDCVNPHWFEYIFNQHAVTENKEYIYGPFTQFNSVNILRINHYWQRDRDFFWNIKAKRQKQWWNYSEEKLKEIEGTFNDEYDDILCNTCR